MGVLARDRFLCYVRTPQDTRPVVSPFLPHPDVVQRTLCYLGLPITGDPVRDEIRLSQALDYEPMFMTDCPGLIFPWQVDESRSDEAFEVSFIDTAKGPWVRRVPHGKNMWSGESGCPVQTEADHEMLVLVCEQIGDREQELRSYFRQWRHRVGDDGVIVLGHPHPSWLGYQISPERIFSHWQDHEAVFRRSMEAIYEAALFVMDLAMMEGVDFMSDSSYGLEMTSPAFFEAMDLPYVRAFADWTHEQGGLFWYHNCGLTRRLVLDGTFNRLGADVIETFSPPPEGDNDLVESRRHIDAAICTKGNLSLPLLRDGAVERVVQQTQRMVEGVRGYAHIFSTADAVLHGTPPENLIAFVRAAREAAHLI